MLDKFHLNSLRSKGNFTRILSFAEIFPSEEFDLTANSLGGHIETHGGLILRMLSYHTVTSQDDSHFEITVSFQ